MVRCQGDILCNLERNLCHLQTTHIYVHTCTHMDTSKKTLFVIKYKLAQHRKEQLNGIRGPDPGKPHIIAPRIPFS